jgi:hypothetical protein
MASVDPIETNTKFAAENKADYPILSDTDKKVGIAYGVDRSDCAARAPARPSVDLLHRARRQDPAHRPEGQREERWRRYDQEARRVGRT